MVEVGYRLCTDQDVVPGGGDMALCGWLMDLNPLFQLYKAILVGVVCEFALKFLLIRMSCRCIGRDSIVQILGGVEVGYRLCTDQDVVPGGGDMEL